MGPEAELQKLRRPSLDATQEERRTYFHDLRDALTEAGVEPGDEFVVVGVSESGRGVSLLDLMEAVTGPATEDPSGNGLGGFARDSKTSRKAALDNYPRSGTQRARVLAAVMGAGAGYTRDELSEALGMPPNVLTPRVKELLDGGWIETTVFNGKTLTRKTRAGSDADVLYASEKARTYGT